MNSSNQYGYHVVPVYTKAPASVEPPKEPPIEDWIVAVLARIDACLHEWFSKCEAVQKGWNKIPSGFSRPIQYSGLIEIALITNRAEAEIKIWRWGGALTGDEGDILEYSLPLSDPFCFQKLTKFFNGE